MRAIAPAFLLAALAMPAAAQTPAATQALSRHRQARHRLPQRGRDGQPYAAARRLFQVGAGPRAASRRPTSRSPRSTTPPISCRALARERSQREAARHRAISTVVQAKPSDWQRDPFTPVVENGYLYGRGATDMKLTRRSRPPRCSR
ncbi:hypothetical protein AB5I41_12950 [Sphingomonas sp. MMS24-JH45]